MSQLFIRTNAPVLKYALGTPGEHLGLKLGSKLSFRQGYYIAVLIRIVAIESVRLASFTNHVEIGPCLGCFSTVKGSFVERARLSLHNAASVVSPQTRRNGTRFRWKTSGYRHP